MVWNNEKLWLQFLNLTIGCDAVCINNSKLYKDNK